VCEQTLIHAQYWTTLYALDLSFEPLLTLMKQGLDATKVGASALFSGDEELFAFARCVSRLTQMG
jgi:hypothetical protein